MNPVDELYPAHVEALIANHERALAETEFDGVVIHSGSLLYRFLDDHSYPFTANPHFVHWVPLDHHPECFVVYRGGDSRPTLIMFQPDDYWHKQPDPPAGPWTEFFDIQIATSERQAHAFLPRDRHRHAFIGENESLANSLNFEAINPDSLINRLHWQRTRKTDYEIGCMRMASRLGATAHRAAQAAFMAQASEFEIHQAYLDAIRFTDAELPYGNIIGLNEHAAVLHYHGLDRRPPAQHLSFLIDAGARFRSYASDITRTWLGPDADDSTGSIFRSMIDELNRRQQELVSAATPGTDYADLHRQCHTHVAEILIEHGIVVGESEGLVESGVTRAFFPHGLGHLIGLQVHDVAGFQKAPAGGDIEKPDDHPYLRLTRTLEAGMVTTIEPGIYFIPSLLGPLKETPAGRQIDWDRVGHLSPYGGIRIEDDILVTDEAPVNLTREAFRQIDREEMQK